MDYCSGSGRHVPGSANTALAWRGPLAFLPVLFLGSPAWSTQRFQKVVILNDRFFNQIRNLVPYALDLNIFRVFGPGSMAIQHNSHILLLDL